MLSRLAVGAVAVLVLVAAADSLRDRGESEPPPAAPTPAAEPVLAGTSLRQVPPACTALQPQRGEKPSIVALECEDAVLDGSSGQVVIELAPG